MELTITYGDGTTKTVTVKPGDFVAFERKYNTDWDAAQEHPRIEYVFFLAWKALTRTKQETRTFDEFLDDVDDLDSDEQAAPLDQPAN